MVPLDHLLLPQARTLPALVVVRLPNGLNHFVIAWRRFGDLLEAMDPAEGRVWLSEKSFAGRVHVHEQMVTGGDWREWAGSPEFLNTLRRRARRARVPRQTISRLIDSALADGSWRSLALLDAAVRMLGPLSESGLSRSRESAEFLEQLLRKCRTVGMNAFEIIPPVHWSVLPSDAEGEHLLFRGAVVLHVRGRLAARSEAVQTPQPAAGGQNAEPPASRPLRQLMRLLLADGWLAPLALTVAMAGASGAVVLEALLYRTFADLPSVLGLTQQRLAALAMLLGFLGGSLCLDLLTGDGWLRAGRKLETRLRAHLLRAIPRLPDRYFRSRLISDMAERCHAIHEIRNLPMLGGQLIRCIFELIITILGLVWLDPRVGLPAILCALFAVLLPLAAQRVLAERDLRFRTHTGGLCRFYFDALRGLIPVRAHGAADAFRVEHEDLLVSWTRAGSGLLRAAVTLEGTGLLISFGLIAWLVIGHVLRHEDSAGTLLMVYWALNVPVLGAQIAQIAWQYPRQRNLALRLLEPLGLPAIGEPERSSDAPARHDGVSIVFQDVSVRALGQTILREFSLSIEPGAHVCIIGPSGAGKSTLAGLLLGWHFPSTGTVLVDGLPLDAILLESLRSETAWVDPNVHIWNRSLAENLAYGVRSDSVGQSIDTAGLLSLIEKLPHGLQSGLGEGGSLVSGGEGQRVRFGRASARPEARLVILDEPFTALDREHRREFLARSRKIWRHATLLCITHDVAASCHFDRVLILEQGRIVEYGSPAELTMRADSRYCRMLEAEQAVRDGVWSRRMWRSLRIEDGQIVEDNECGHDKRVDEPVLARCPVGRGTTGLEPDERPHVQLQ